MANIANLLEGKVAIVTGARRGIGKTVALDFARAGADVAICDVMVEDGILDAIVKDINKMKRNALSFKVDVSNKADIDNMVNQVIAKFKKIDILVNSAGIWIPGKTLLECTEKEWDVVNDVDLKGTFLCCQAVANKMVERKQGSIINIASDLGIVPVKLMGGYGGAKGGVINFTRQLALELAEHHIRVNAIAPGMIRTEMNAQLRSNPEIEKKLAASMMIGRLGETEDISNAVVFLASDMASYITAQIICVNGGGQMAAPVV